MNPLFALSAKHLVTLVEPLALVWLGALVLAGWLHWKRKLKREAIAAASLAFVLWLFGATPVPGWLLGSLEKPYAGMPVDRVPKANAVVLLGGGSSRSKFEAQKFHINRAGDRVIMALDLMHSNRAPALVLGGAFTKSVKEETVWPDSETTANWMRAGGKLGDAEVIPLKICRNTYDEARFVKEIYDARGWTNILLVTSAFHMKRSAAVFRSHGIHTTEIPCNFFTLVGRYGSPQVKILPKHQGMEKMSILIHELVGWAYYRLRGWITADGIQEGLWWESEAGENTP